MAYTPHPCQNSAQHSCKADDCGGTYSSTRFAGDCDPDGCDFNPYRMGVKDFYGKGMTLDTSKKFSIITQFIGSGETLQEIKQLYVQDGKRIDLPNTTWPGLSGNSITPEFCKAQKQVFGDKDRFNDMGGFDNMAKALAKGMVLVLSLWDDVRCAPLFNGQFNMNDLRLTSTSITPTCFGSTQPTPPMLIHPHPAKDEAHAIPAVVSRRMSSQRMRTY